MKQIGNMKLYSLEEVTDELIGPKGSLEREKFDRQVEESLHTYRIGEAIKKERLRQNLTQDELGKRVGVQRSQICRLESGRTNITIPVMSRVFQALGIATATLDLGAAGKIALW